MLHDDYKHTVRSTPSRINEQIYETETSLFLWGRICSIVVVANVNTTETCFMHEDSTVLCSDLH